MIKSTRKTWILEFHKHQKVNNTEFFLFICRFSCSKVIFCLEKTDTRTENFPVSLHTLKTCLIRLFNSTSTQKSLIQNRHKISNWKQTQTVIKINFFRGFYSITIFDFIIFCLENFSKHQAKIFKYLFLIPTWFWFLNFNRNLISQQSNLVSQIFKNSCQGTNLSTV